MTFLGRRILQRLSARGLATHSFSKTIAAGPGLDEFIQGEDTVEDDTVVLGNTSQCVYILHPSGRL